MSDFKREERYIVVKLKDIGAEEAEALRGFLRSWKIPTRECVVVEPHWPNYADTWKAVEQVAKGEYQSPHYKIEQLQQRIAELEQRNNELSATVERLRLAMMAAICVMPSGEAKADLRDAYDATPQQNLNAACEKCERKSEHDNLKAAMQIVDTLSDNKTGIIELSVGGVSFNAKLDGYAILNDVFGKSVELHGFTIHCGKDGEQ